MNVSVLRITLISVLASVVLVPIELARLNSTPSDAHAQTAAQPKPAPSEDRVGFPEGYEQWPQLYVFDRPDNRQVRVIYGNAEAAAGNPSAPPNQVFPYGSIMVMETWRAKLDANGNPELDVDVASRRSSSREYL